MIVEGRVRVNGAPVTELGTRVDPSHDRIEVDGRVVAAAEETRWVLLHKPAGIVTTRRDPQGRPTVYSLLAPADRGLRYVGRLDLDTEGLLLFTNDGDLLHALTHPSSEIPREYRVEVGGVPSEETLESLRSGIQLEDGPARADRVRVEETLSGGRGALLSLVIREGRKREVRRMLEAVGHSVRRLRRVAFGPIGLGKLEAGKSRVLSPAEIGALRSAIRPGGGRTRSGSTPPPRRGGRSGTP
jgi:pseudouridine synthase